MDFELPSEFDLIVVGTGFTESIIAAAASRIGKNVLHVDNKNYYGGFWASFGLEAISNVTDHLKIEGNSSENIISIGNDYFTLNDIKEEWLVNGGDGDAKNAAGNDDKSDNKTDTIIWNKEKLLALSRKFNIDLMPKLHFARGDFVELMISSNIARYSEFRSVSRILTWLDNKLEVVPCSRSDVFSSNNVSVVEKRMLMKLLNVCLETADQDFAEYKDKTFHTFLKDQKLSDNLIHYILYALAMGTDKIYCQEGMDRVKRFLNSLGRYGKTPFLYSMYGSGEIPQAFCRLSAVFGATYALARPLEGIELDEKNNFKSIICGNQKISAPNVVLGLDKAPKKLLKPVKPSRLARGVFITDRSIMEGEKEHLSLLIFPPLEGKNSITVIEMGCLTGTCPKGTYLIHMWTEQVTEPHNDLKHCIENLFGKSKDEEEKPNLLWSFYFSMPLSNDIKLENEISNLFICPGPDSDFDYDPSIKIAKEIFEKLYPGAEFLPRAPDPEEIVIEGEDSAENEEIIQKDSDEKCKEQNEKNEITEAVHNDG